MAKEQPIILIVDDEPSLRRLLREILSEAGFQVITASDTTTALDLLAVNQPDLIIADLMLPQAGGAVFIQQVRSLRGFKETPIMVLSGFSAGLGPTAKAAGATVILRKPDDISNLAEVARQLIDQSASQ